MSKINKQENQDDVTDITLDENANNLSHKYFVVKINDKINIPIDKTIKAKKSCIYDILKERILAQGDFILSKKNNFIMNKKVTNKLKKHIKYSQLQEKIHFGNLDYLNNKQYEGSSRNPELNLNLQSLLKSQYFIFRPGVISSKKKIHYPKTENRSVKNKKINKSVLKVLGLKKNENKIRFNTIHKEKDEINKNYFNTQTSEIFDGSINNHYLDIKIINNKNNKKKFSNDLSFHSESITPRSNILFLDKKIKNEKNQIISPIKKNNLENKDENISQNSNNENNNKKDKKRIFLKGGTIKIMNSSTRATLKNLILNCIDNNAHLKRNNTVSRKKTNKSKYNYTYRKSFISKNSDQILKSFQKHLNLMDKEEDKNNKNNDSNNNLKINIIENKKKLEKEYKIKKNFCKLGSKTISSLVTTINNDQVELNNRLFKIIDRANKTIKKEKQIDKVLEIILDKKLKKKKRIKAKEIFVDAMDGRKLIEERNKLRFMMRFADLVKDMNDEMALNFTKHIIDKNSELKNDFILPEIEKFKKLKKLKYLEKQRNIRDRLINKNSIIENRLILNEIEKENLYNRYENIFKKNRLMNMEKNYKLKNTKKEDNIYHNIVLIVNNFEKDINE